MKKAVIEKIKADYLDGMKYRDIIEKYNITLPELRSIIYKNKLTRDKSKAQIGNKNAVGNKGGHPAEGNTNAVTTGEYESIYKDVLAEEELELYDNINTDNQEQLLINDYKILTIREKRMLHRIKGLQEKNNDLTVIKMQKNNKTSQVETQNTLFLIGKIEDGLTRVQEAKRKTLESLNKLNTNPEDSKTLNVNFINGSPLLESINRQLGGNRNGTE